MLLRKHLQNIISLFFAAYIGNVVILELRLKCTIISCRIVHAVTTIDCHICIPVTSIPANLNGLYKNTNLSVVTGIEEDQTTHGPSVVVTVILEYC